MKNDIGSFSFSGIYNIEGRDYRSSTTNKNCSGTRTQLENEKRKNTVSDISE